MDLGPLFRFLMNKKKILVDFLLPKGTILSAAFSIVYYQIAFTFQHFFWHCITYLILLQENGDSPATNGQRCFKQMSGDIGFLSKRMIMLTSNLHYFVT